MATKEQAAFIKARVILAQDFYEVDDIAEFAVGEAVPAWADADPAAVAYAESLQDTSAAPAAEG